MDPAALQEQLDEQKRKVEFYKKASTEKDETITALRKETQQLKDSQQSLLFADDKDLASKLKKVEYDNGELNTQMTRLKMKAKIRIQELEADKKKNSEMLEEQAQKIEKLMAEVQTKSSVVDLKKVDLSEASGWDDDGDAEKLEGEVAPQQSASADAGESKAKVAKLVEEKSALEKERDALNEMLSAVTAKLASKEEAMQAQASELEKAKFEVHQRETEHEAQIRRLTENQSQIPASGDDTNSELASLRAGLKELEPLRATVDTLQKQLTEKVEAYEKLVEEKEDESIKLLESQQATFNQTSAEKDARLKKLETQLHDALQQAEALHQGMASLEKEQKGALDAGKQEIERLSALLSEKEAVPESPKESLEFEEFKKKAKAKVASMQQANLAQKQESDEREAQLRQNVSALQVLAEKIQQENIELEIKLKAAQDAPNPSAAPSDPSQDQEKLELSSKLTALQQENALVKQKIGQLIAEKEATVSEIQLKLDEATLQIEEADEKSEKHWKEVVALREHLQEFNQQLAFDSSETAAAIEAKEAKIQELTASVSAAEELLRKAEKAASDQMERAAREKAVLEAELATLTSGSTSTSHVEEVVKAQEQEMEIQDMAATIARLEDVIQSLGATNDNYEQDIRRFREKMSTDDEKMVRLQEKLDATESQFSKERDLMQAKLKEVTEQSKSREQELGSMINKGVELEGLLADLRAKDKQKDEAIQQLKHDLSQQTALLERSRAEFEATKHTHHSELQRVNSQLDLSTGKLQKAQGEEVALKQLQMRIDQLQGDLEKVTRESEDKERLVQEERSRNEHLKEEQTNLTVHFDQQQQQLRAKMQQDAHDVQEKNLHLHEAGRQIDELKGRCARYETQFREFESRLVSIQQTSEMDPADELIAENQALSEEIVTHKTKIAKLEDKLQMILKQQEARNEEKKTEDATKSHSSESKLKGDLEEIQRENEQLRERLRSAEAAPQGYSLREGVRRSNSEEREFAPFTLFEDPSAPLDLEGRTPQPPSWRRSLQNLGQYCDVTSIRAARVIKKNSLVRVFGLVYFIVINVLVLFYFLMKIFSPSP